MTQLVEVQVKQGLLRGQRLTPPLPLDAAPFDAFLGVPYARPPLGPLRFRAPQPPEPWEGARPALDDAKRCLQYDFMLGNMIVGGEDCLYLNVYTPQVPASVRHPVDGAPWPVMVWFFPGGFSSGNPNMSEYAPEYLCARGVVVVTVGYRLGALGFLSLNSKTLPGNAGLKDGVAALRWVQENIASFGGDPTRVTIFGCSAGGAYAEYLQYAPAARGLFHRAISQSGSVTAPWASVEPELARVRAFRLGKLLGCDTQDDKVLVDFLQKLPAKDIFDKAKECIDFENENANNLAIAFLPCSERDAEDSGEEAFLVDTPRSLLHSHRFFPVPWITGFTDCEGMLTLFDEFTGKSVSGTEAGLEAADKDLERVVPDDLKLAKGSPQSKAIADRVRQLYFNGGKVTRNGYFNLYTDLLFVYGGYECARFHATHPIAAPVYVYLFCLMGQLSRLDKLVKVENAPGVCHGDEMWYIFGCRPPMAPEPALDEHSIEIITRRRMTAMWTNFAATGNPTPASDPNLAGIDWQPIPPTKEGPTHYLNIGPTLSVPAEPLFPERMAFWEDVYVKHLKE